MLNNKSLVHFCRWLFGILLVVSGLLGWQISPHFNIDTNLADVSPATQNTIETRAAIAKLRTSIEKRAILLIQSNDEDNVFNAEDYLRSELKNLTELTVFDSNQLLLEKAFDGLLKYRFSLLSEEQRSILHSSSAQDIADRAELNLYKSSGEHFFSFDKDPLGWHSNTLLDLLNSSQSGISNRQPDTGFAESISFTINDGALSMKTQERLSKILMQLIQSTERRYGVQLDTSGVFFFAASAATQAKADIQLISIGSGIGVILLLLLAFRSIWSLVLPLASIAIGVAFAFVLTHFIYGQVHILTLVFGASLIGIVIDYSLHYFYHRSGEKGISARNKPTTKSAHYSQNGALYRALMLSLGTSLIGYGALSFSSLDALQKVAFFSCCGLLMAWLSVMCFGQWATNKSLHLNQTVFANVADKITSAVKRLSTKIWLIIAITVVTIAAALILFSTPFNDDPRVFFKPSAELINSERRVAAATNDYEPGRYIIIHGKSQAQVHERYINLMNLVTNEDTLNPTNLSSILSWIPSQAQQQQNYQQYSKLYKSGGAADLLSQSLSSDTKSIDALRAEYRNSNQVFLSPNLISALMGEALPPFWMEYDVNGNSSIFVNFVLIRKGVVAGTLSSLTNSLAGVEYVNTLERTRDALKSQRQSAIAMLLIAYLLIAALILTRYRKLSSLWMIAVPICASASVIISCALVGVSLNLFHIMALFLVLGFGMDYTIFTKEMNFQSKIQQALSLQAILLSALTSLLSFGLLGLSSMPVVASFGLTLLLGNVFNLIGVFVAANIVRSQEKRQICDHNPHPIK